jgi:acid phosphatase
MKKILFLYLFAGLIFAGCCTTELTNLSDLKQAIINYQETGGYDKDMNTAVEEAKDKFSKVNFTGKSVVVFDIDETALQNYEINKALDFGYVPAPWDEWVKQANAPAIPQVKDLYDFLLQKGAEIIFLTGRNADQYEPTIKNLVEQGYTKFDTVITRNEEEADLTALDYKTAKRIALTKQGYKIEGTVGDQWSDLKGEYHGIQVKLPNYIYKIE